MWNSFVCGTQKERIVVVNMHSLVVIKHIHRLVMATQHTHRTQKCLQKLAVLQIFAVPVVRTRWFSTQSQDALMQPVKSETFVFLNITGKGTKDNPDHPERYMRARSPSGVCISSFCGWS